VTSAVIKIYRLSFITGKEKVSTVTSYHRSKMLANMHWISKALIITLNEAAIFIYEALQPPRNITGNNAVWVVALGDRSVDGEFHN